MQQVEEKKGPGAATPKPHAITFEAIAPHLYANRMAHGNPNEQWVLVPRSLFAMPLEAITEQLNTFDKYVERLHTEADAPENAL